MVKYNNLSLNRDEHKNVHSKSQEEMDGDRNQCITCYGGLKPKVS